MANLHIHRLMNFDHGIDNVSYTGRRDNERQELPERLTLAPADDPVRPQLDQLLDKPSLDHILATELRPRIDKRDLLLPAQFRLVLETAQRDLATLMQQGLDNAGILSQAVDVLREESALRDLATANRNALFQG